MPVTPKDATFSIVKWASDRSSMGWPRYEIYKDPCREDMDYKILESGMTFQQASDKVSLLVGAR